MNSPLYTEQLSFATTQAQLSVSNGFFAFPYGNQQRYSVFCFAPQQSFSYQDGFCTDQNGHQKISDLPSCLEQFFHEWKHVPTYDRYLPFSGRKIAALSFEVLAEFAGATTKTSNDFPSAIAWESHNALVLDHVEQTATLVCQDERTAEQLKLQLAQVKILEKKSASLREGKRSLSYQQLVREYSGFSLEQLDKLPRFVQQCSFPVSSSKNHRQKLLEEHHRGHTCLNSEELLMGAKTQAPLFWQRQHKISSTLQLKLADSTNLSRSLRQHEAQLQQHEQCLFNITGTAWEETRTLKENTLVCEFRTSAPSSFSACAVLQKITASPYFFPSSQQLAFIHASESSPRLWHGGSFVLWNHENLLIAPLEESFSLNSTIIQKSEWMTSLV